MMWFLNEAQNLGLIASQMSFMSSNESQIKWKCANQMIMAIFYNSELEFLVSFPGFASSSAVSKISILCLIIWPCILCKYWGYKFLYSFNNHNNIFNWDWKKNQHCKKKYYLLLFNVSLWVSCFSLIFFMQWVASTSFIEFQKKVVPILREMWSVKI